MPLMENAVANITGIVPSLQSLVEPLVAPVQQFLTFASAILGGVFGLYVISILLRVFYERKVLREVRALKKDIAALSEQMRKKK